MVVSVGETEDTMVISSCGTEGEATSALLMFGHYLNYRQVKPYQGSHSENRVVRGMERRQRTRAGVVGIKGQTAIA